MRDDQDGPYRIILIYYLPLLLEPSNRPVSHGEHLVNPQDLLAKIPGRGQEEGGHGKEED